MKEDNVKFTPVLCVFDKERDIVEVDQFGAIDLRAAFISGTVPGDLIADPEAYNGVEDPASLLGKPSDTFDAIRKAQYVKSAESAAKAEAAAASSAGTE